MDPNEIARAGEEQCVYMGHVGGRPWFCVRRANHPGVHAAEPGPGETVTWPKEGDTGPMTGILGPYGLKPDTPESQQRQTSDYGNREARRDAVELAVRALTPIIPAFPGDTIGRAVIELATELGAYIRNGA